MDDSLSEIIDILAWIIGGLFVGLIVLGAYNFYREYQDPSLPSPSITPLEEEQIEPEQQDKTFQPMDRFYLVQKHSPKENTDDQEASTEPESRPDESRTDTTPVNELPVTELPYQLLGTTTGAPAYNTASVRHRKDNTTRIITNGETWNDFRVETIGENEIIILNQRRERRERMVLSESDKN